jgi:hypothetical protein
MAQSYVKAAKAAIDAEDYEGALGHASEVCNFCLLTRSVSNYRGVTQALSIAPTNYNALILSGVASSNLDKVRCIVIFAYLYVFSLSLVAGGYL